MNWSGLRACVRREVVGGTRSLSIFAGGAVLALVLALLLPGNYSLIPGPLALILAVVTLFAPSADLARDRLSGNFEADRALPVPPRTVAAGRLIGAAIRTLPFPLCVLGFVLALARESDAAVLPSLITASLIAVGVMLTGMMFCWTILALNARWSLRRIWWLGPTVAFMPQLLPLLLPRAVTDALVSDGHLLADRLGVVVAQPIGLMAVVVVAAMLPMVVFSAATLLFASGIVHYRYDATAMHAGAAALPRRELRAIGRGPVLAVTQLRLRLSMEQFQRELIIVVILLLVVVFAPRGGLFYFARGYVRVLAALIPGGIALQLTQSRSRGDLEGLQQLPCGGIEIGLGHLAAIVVMAIPGALVLVVALEVEGARPTVASALAVWGWFVTVAWLAAVGVVWLRKWNGLFLAVPLLALLLWVAHLGLDEGFDQIAAAFGAINTIRERGGAPLALAAMLVAIAVGMPIFARGLKRYKVA